VVYIYNETGDRIPVEARFSVPVINGPRTTLATCTVGAM